MSDGSKQQHLYESLSALVDNEASELELHRILSESERDPSVRARWHRYQLARTALKGEVIAASVDISDAVRDAVSNIDLSEVQLSNQRQKKSSSSQGALADGHTTASINSGNSSTHAGEALGDSNSAWKANVARFAIAASVASVVLISSQQFDLFTRQSDASLFASSESNIPVKSTVSESIDAVPQNSPFAVVDLQNVAGTFNSLSTPQQSRLPQQAMRYSPTQQQKQLQDERVRLYIQQLMLEHAESAAQHSGSGLMPYTRAPVEGQR
ncbi:MAG: sigma-E factor negative regulatory protein [Cellvibrionaceae bacterium]